MGWLGHAAWACKVLGTSNAPRPSSAARRDAPMSVAIEGALGSGPGALGDGGFGRAVGGHRVERVGAGHAHRPVAFDRDPLHRARRSAGPSGCPTSPAYWAAISRAADTRGWWPGDRGSAAAYRSRRS